MYDKRPSYCKFYRILVLCSNLHINDYDTQALTQTLVILKQSVLNSMPELDSNELKLLEENKMNAWAAYHQRTGFPKSWTGLKVKEIFEKCNLKEK